MPKFVDWYMNGKIYIDVLITHTMPLERINERIDLMHMRREYSLGRRLLIVKDL